MSNEVVILGGARTPFGSFGGSLKDLSATDLGAHAARAALERSHVPAGDVDNVVFGNVVQTSTDAAYLARHVALKAGCPIETPAVTVNRLCGSGLEALVNAARAIRAGESEVALVGGAESMSQAPHVVYGARWGAPFGQPPAMRDILWEALVDTYAGCGMAVTAENLARDYGISREACDAYALRSQHAAAAARAACRFNAEIEPIGIKSRAGATLMERDETIREDASAEGLARLKARFVDGGVVTPGNASGVTDGAAALVIASESAAARYGVQPLGRVVAWGVAGVDPTRMGIGPAPASRMALKRAALTIDDMDLVEINEAFAAQYLAVEQELGLDRERTNVNGGAIALGHPLGASGARLALTLLTELRQRHAQRGLASLCIGGGQGIAAIFEAI